MADELIMTAGATESVNLAFNATDSVSLISAIRQQFGDQFRKKRISGDYYANENGQE